MVLRPAPVVQCCSNTMQCSQCNAADHENSKHKRSGALLRISMRRGMAAARSAARDGERVWVGLQAARACAHAQKNLLVMRSHADREQRVVAMECAKCSFTTACQLHLQHLGMHANACILQPLLTRCHPSHKRIMHPLSIFGTADLDLLQHAGSPRNAASPKLP